MDLSATIAQLTGADLAQRVAAAEYLASLGTDAQPAALPLLDCVEQADESLMEWSSAALEGLGPPRQEDLAGLIDHLQQHANNQDRATAAYWAATLIGRLGHGETAQPAVAILIQLASGAAKPEVQQRAIWALGRIGADNPSALAALEQLAANPDQRMATQARRALEDMRE